MATHTLTLNPMGIVTAAGWSRLEWSLEGFNDEGFVLRHAVTESDSHLLGDPERGDHAVAAILLWAMQHGKDIVVKGRVSPQLLDGLETLQAIWQRWRPNRYRVITIQADEESELTPTVSDRSAIFAFSGGVDASFSLFRHLQGQAGRNTRRPGAALLVHGMDIPLERDDFYRSAAERAERMLAGTGVPLIRMQTNSRRLGQDWEDSFGMQLGACFLTLQTCFKTAVRGSGEPYDTLVLPWGATPLTDSLGSTGIMQLEHDGCAFDRTEKVEWLFHHTKITNELRVCWAGPNLDRNCGECEKCVRTMLNFWAVGAAIPSAFPTQLTPERVRSVNPRKEVQLRELRSILRHSMNLHSSRDPILRALRKVLRNAALAAVKWKLAYLGRRSLERLNLWP